MAKKNIIKLTNSKRKLYEKEIDRLMTKNKGKLTPEELVFEAQNPRSPLHNWFTWNDSEEAHLWRLHKARILFGCIVKEIEVKSLNGTKEIRKYINVQTSKHKNAYVPITKAISTKKYSDQILSQCITLSQSLTIKLELFQKEI